MKIWLSRNVFIAVAAIAFLNVDSTRAADRFSVVIGPKDQLIIFSPNGEKAAELTPPAIAQPVKAGATNLQVSFGRDANDLWTAIITPSSSQASDISFSVLDNKIDADKNSVVTLTFAKDLKRVSVDPGYLGVVKVNNSQIKGSTMVASASTPPPIKPAATVTPRTEPAPAKSVAAAPKPAAMAPDDGTPKVETAPPAQVGVANMPDVEAALALPTAAELNPKKTYWSEPITPPDPKNLPATASNEIKLTEVQGNVTVTLPNATEEVAATNGMTVPSGSVVKTGPDGSAAAFLGGVNSARFMPNSDATLNQTVASSKRTTLIDLKNGIVFANVGRKSGETQDFKVKTAGGVAAAKGTSFVVRAEGNRLFVATYNGGVNLTDANGKFIGTSSPSAPGIPGTMSNDGATDMANNALLAQILAIVQKFNSKVNELEAKLANDPNSLTPQERTWLARAPKIAERYAEELNELLIRSNGGPGTGGAEGIGPGNGGFGAGFNNINFNPNAVIEPTTPS